MYISDYQLGAKFVKLMLKNWFFFLVYRVSKTAFSSGYQLIYLGICYIVLFICKNWLYCLLQILKPRGTKSRLSLFNGSSTQRIELNSTWEVLNSPPLLKDYKNLNSLHMASEGATRTVVQANYQRGQIEISRGALS